MRTGKYCGAYGSSIGLEQQLAWDGTCLSAKDEEVPAFDFELALRHIDRTNRHEALGDHSKFARCLLSEGPVNCIRMELTYIPESLKCAMQHPFTLTNLSSTLSPSALSLV